MPTTPLEVLVLARSLLLAGHRDALWDVYRLHFRDCSAYSHEFVSVWSPARDAIRGRIAYGLNTVTQERELELYDEAIYRLQQDSL